MTEADRFEPAHLRHVDGEVDKDHAPTGPRVRVEGDVCDSCEEPVYVVPDRKIKPA